MPRVANMTIRPLQACLRNSMLKIQFKRKKHLQSIQNPFFQCWSYNITIWYTATVLLKRLPPYHLSYKMCKLIGKKKKTKIC